MSSAHMKTPNLRGLIHPELEQSVSQVYHELRRLRAEILGLKHSIPSPAPSIGDIQTNLQIGGSNPLNITKLIGGTDYDAEAGVGKLLRTDGQSTLTGVRTISAAWTFTGLATFNRSGVQWVMNDSSATGSPSFEIQQAGVRRSFIQHHDVLDDLRVASEFGRVSIWTGIGGGEDLHFELGS